MPTLLIIRPEARAQQEIAVCREAGWQAKVLSPIAIEPDEQAIGRLPQTFARADIVFWVSPSAVETAAPHIDFSDGLKTHVAVGKATAAALSRAGAVKIVCPDGGNDSEAVSALPLWQNPPPNAQVLIVRGHGGRDFLAQDLAKKGWSAEYAEIYFRRHNNLNFQDFDCENIAAAYITSAGQVSALFQQIPPQFARFFKTLLYLTHHPRVARALSEAGAQQIKVVAKLDAAALQTVSHGANMSQSADNTPEKPNNDNVIAVNADGQALPNAQQPRNEAEPAARAANENTGNRMSEPQQTPQAPAAPVVIKQSSGKGLAAGALVLALLGLGASGFLFVQGQNVLKNQELAFSQKIDKAALGESENAALLKDNLNRQSVIQTELERLGSGQKANNEQIAQTRKAYQELLKGRVNWLVDEAETMLNVAAQQLLLSGNVQGAAGVLEHINGRLSRFDQPELLPIKQAVSSDLAALKNRPYVDVSGTALRIDRLETAVAGLPLVVDGTLKPGAAEKVPTDANLPWWENAWQKSLGALKGLVEVRRLDNNDAMLLSPEQIYFVRENLRLRLLDARTALLQHNGEVFQSDLNNVEATVKQYFDNRSPATQSWLKEIAELKTLDVRMIADDALKASLAAVRTYQDGARAALPAAQPQQAQEQDASAPAAAASEPAANDASAAQMPKEAPKAPALPSENKAEPADKAASSAAPAAQPKQPVAAPKAKGEAA